MGWRLLLYMLLTVLVTAAAMTVLPPGLLAGAAATLAGALAAGWTVLALDGRKPGALGFYLARASARESLGGVAVGVGVASAIIGAIALFGALRWSPEPGTAVDWLVGAGGAAAFLAVPAAAEEAVLRGYPLQALAESWGPAWALWITAAAFGALHLSNPGVTALAAVNVAGAGLLLGVVYLRTASLWWATGVHLGWNWAQGYLADVPVSGLELMDAPFYEGIAGGPAWLGGGAFGPEGSVLTTLVVLAAAALLWTRPWLRPSRAALAARPLAVALGSGRA